MDRISTIQVATFGNLNGKKFKQHSSRKRKEKKAAKETVDPTNQEMAAAIQRNYRSYCSRKWTKLVNLEQEIREIEMILLVQNAINEGGEEGIMTQKQAM